MTPHVILLTGGGGFIGQSVARHLAARGHTVIAPARATLDLCDGAATAGFVARHSPSAVVHLASPAMADPVTGELAVIEAEATAAENLIRAVPVTARFLHAGSMAEYGRGGRLSETTACRPVSVYGRAKVAACDRVRDIAQARGVEASILRIFGAFGRGESARRLFPQLLAARGQSGQIALSDGRQQRDFVLVDDIAITIARLLDRTGPLAPVYNIGTGQAVSVRSAVERIAEEAGIGKGRLAFGALPRSPLDEDVLEADTTLLQAAIGWVPAQRFLSGQPILPLIA